MEGRTPRLRATSHGVKLLARWVQDGSFTTTSFREPISQRVDGDTVDLGCHDELMNNGFAFAVKNATCTEANHSYSCLTTEGTCKASYCNVELAQGSVTEYRSVSNDSEQALISAVAQQQHDRLGGDSLQDYAVFNRVTRVVGAGYVSDVRAKANSLTGTVPGRDVCVVLNDVLATLKMRTIAAKPAWFEGECGNPHTIPPHVPHTHHVPCPQYCFQSVHAIKYSICSYLCTALLRDITHASVWLKLSQIENSHLHIPSSMYLTR